MPEPNTSNSSNTRKNRQKQPEQRATSREKTTSQSTGQEEVRNPWFAQLGGDFSQATFERHAGVLGDGRMSHSSNVSQRAEIVQQLQRTYGNQYVQRLVDHVSRKRIEGVQTKLTVGPAGDEYEREADRVAKQVVGMPDSPARESAQRQEEEEELQMKPLQRQEEEEELPMKTLQREIGAEGGNVGPETEQTIQQARGSGQSLPDDVRTSMESAFGADFSGVKVHNDAESDALNESVSARAFTTGQDIFFKQGEYNPGSSSGKEVLAHELTHVVQQYGAGSPRQKWEKEDPVQMKALQRQDEEVEPPELEGTLPDGTMVDNEQFRRGPCDCRGCDASHHQRSSSLRRNGSQSRVLRRDGSGGGTPTDYNVKVGKISFDFSNPGTMAVDPYGEEDFSCAHEDAEWKTKRDKLTVKFKIDLFCKWGVDGGGNTDITSGTDAAVTADKWKDIANDLTPSKDDNWRPPRTDYWSKSLTQRHEKFHSLQDEKWAKGKGQKVVKDYLKGKTVSASDLETDLDDLLDESMDEMDSANFEWYSGGGKAYIERPGEKAAFKDGKKPYKSLAKAVKKQGKKLEKEAADLLEGINMPSSSETNEPPRLCHIHIVAAGLPHRGEIILERERNLFSMMADRLMGRGKRHSEEGVRSVPMQALEKAFSERKARTLPSAAFVAGRCQPCAPEDQERLTAVIRDLLDSLPAETPGTMSRAYIEASMSLALRGDTDRARQALAALIANAPDSSVSYLVAFYLAQLGDPSGFPAMKDALRGTNEHTRLMALRHLIAFKPYDGQTIQDNAVNIRAELTQRLVDHDPYVRVEVPYYMAEACVEDLNDLLEPVAQNDRNKDVREAARSILERVVQ